MAATSRGVDGQDSPPFAREPADPDQIDRLTLPVLAKATEGLRGDDVDIVRDESSADTREEAWPIVSDDDDGDDPLRELAPDLDVAGAIPTAVHDGGVLMLCVLVEDAAIAHRHRADVGEDPFVVGPIELQAKGVDVGRRGLRREAFDLVHVRHTSFMPAPSHGEDAG